MTLEQLRAVISAVPKGANIVVEWERPVKLRKAYATMPMTKHSKMLCRIGVDYDHKQPTKDGRADGSLPAENAGLNGMTWVDFPTILQSNKTGKYYLRLEAGTFGNVKTETEFRLDGQPVEKADWAHTMLASESTPSKRFGTFNIGAETILRIHNHEVENENEGEAENA
jgi:hypothetical protein